MGLKGSIILELTSHCGDCCSRRRCIIKIRSISMFSILATRKKTRIKWMMGISQI